MGVCFYLGHLAHQVFEDSWLFPMALTAIGLGIICLGVLWQKHEDGITQRVRQILPPALQTYLEAKYKGEQ